MESDSISSTEPTNLDGQVPLYSDQKNKHIEEDLKSEPPNKEEKRKSPKKVKDKPEGMGRL